MGLDFSIGENCTKKHGETARWSYGGFGIFRRKLWSSCGFDGDLYELYNDLVFLRQINEDHPLFALFDHCDCDGELLPEQLIKIVPLLERILENWIPDAFDTRQGRILLKNMKECIEKNVPLIFC